MEQNEMLTKVGNNFDKNKLFYDLYDKFGQSDSLKDMFFISDKPVKYKELLLYPVTMDMCMLFWVVSGCLVLRKNTSGDIKAIQMPYLDYLFYLFEQGQFEYVNYLSSLLLLVLHKNEYALTSEGEIIHNLDDEPIRTIEFITNKETNKMNIGVLKSDIEIVSGFCSNNYFWYDAQDFENIKRIICEQNNLELLDESIHPDKLQKIEEYEKYIREKNKDKVCNLEDRISILMDVSGLSKQQINDMSIRTFENAFDRLKILIDYCIKEILSPNMKESDRKKITSWLGKDKKLSKLEQITQNYDDFNKKFDSNPAQTKSLI